MAVWAVRLEGMMTDSGNMSDRTWLGNRRAVVRAHQPSSLNLRRPGDATPPVASLILAGMVVLFLVVLSTVSHAQGIVVVVNGQLITQSDVTNRLRLLALTNGGKAAPRETALDELIDERLKLQEARKLRITIDESQVDRAFASIAERTKLSVEQLRQALKSRGVNPSTLRDRLRGDIAWQLVVQQRGQRAINIRDQDIVDALKKRGQDPENIRSVEYTMAQIVVFSKGESAARRKEADTLRASVKSCENLAEQLRHAREAAVRGTIRRSSADLPPPIRLVLEKTPINGSTEVQASPLGYEFYMLCDKQEIPGRDAAQAQIRSELVELELEQASRRLLRDARQAAVIDNREK